MIIEERRDDFELGFTTYYRLDSETGVQLRIGVPMLPSATGWDSVAAANGRMGIVRAVYDEPSGRNLLGGVGAAPFDAGVAVTTALAGGALSATLSFDWGFCVFSTPVFWQTGMVPMWVSVSVPESGAVSHTPFFADPPWTDGAELAVVSCAAGQRILAVSGSTAKLSNVIATYDTAWTEAASFSLPSPPDFPFPPSGAWGGWPPSPELLDYEARASAAYTAAIASAVRGLGDELVRAPRLLPDWWLDDEAPGYWGAYISGDAFSAMHDGSVLVAALSAVGAETEEGWNETDTEMITWRISAGGAYEIVEKQVQSSVGVFGIVFLEGEVTATDFSNEITNFWTGFKLAAETP